MSALTLPAEAEIVQLQGVGLQHALRVQDLRPGHVLVWNGGGLSEVVAIVELSRCFVSVVQRTLDDRCFHSRRMRRDRLVGFSPSASARNGALTST